VLGVGTGSNRCQFLKPGRREKVSNDFERGAFLNLVCFRIDFSPGCFGAFVAHCVSIGSDSCRMAGACGDQLGGDVYLRVLGT
jgi:hypothetical protein